MNEVRELVARSAFGGGVATAMAICRCSSAPWGQRALGLGGPCRESKTKHRSEAPCAAKPKNRRGKLLREYAPMSFHDYVAHNPGMRSLFSVGI